MRKFVKKILDNAFQVGGKVYLFVLNCANRTEQIYKSGWTIYKEAFSVRTATKVEVRMLVYKFSDFDLKKNKYLAMANLLVNEINYILPYEGIKDWKLTPLNSLFKGAVVNFLLTRPSGNIVDIGAPSLREALEVICAFFIMKGFYVLDTLVYENGVLIFQAWNQEPTRDDILILDTGITYNEREKIIDEYVEKIISKVEKEAKEAELPFWERLEKKAKDIAFWIVVILICYLIVVNWRTIKKAYELGKSGVEKIKEKTKKES